MNNKNKKAHDKFVGCLPLTTTITIISSDKKHLVQGTVVKDTDEKLKFQLDYLAKKSFKDSSGYIGVRWTKTDLERMLSLLELTEEKYLKEK